MAKSEKEKKIVIEDHIKKEIRNKKGFDMLCDEYIIPNNKLSPKAIELKKILIRIKKGRPLASRPPT